MVYLPVPSCSWEGCETRKKTLREFAVREAMEESENMLSSATKQKLASMSGYLAWIPAIKSCLFFHELTNPEGGEHGDGGGCNVMQSTSIV